MQTDDVVRADALRLFAAAVLELGGDPSNLLRRAHIDAAALDRTDALISYRAMIQVLEQAALELDCPDFGLRLAARQGGIAVLGPLEIAMRNAATVGEAYRYCARHLQVYSPSVHIQIDADPTGARQFMRFEILLSRIPHQRQAVENALALTHHALLSLTHGGFGAREVWFSHQRRAPAATYQRYFGVPVHFDRPLNAVFLNDRDWAQPIADQDPRVYASASNFIDSRFPPTSMSLATRVHVVASRLLVLGLCTQAQVAARINMHPRTLQRRLRHEGTCFEAIKDAVRSDAAYRYLGESTLTMSRVAALLGYSEPSVFTRSCRRWFSSAPRDLRASLSAGIDR